MLTRIFDIEGGNVVPTEHCYTLKKLKVLMDKYPKNYIKMYTYLFYMSCPNPDLNPFFNVPEDDKEELILKEIDADFSTDNKDLIAGLELCGKLYQTPTYRAYMGIKAMLDKLARYMEVTAIEHGRDGNITALINAAAKFQSIRESFKGAYKDLKEEQSSHVRGDKKLSYDTKINS